MASTLTYAGTTIAVVNALPATYDQTGYEALTWEAGSCALRSVPAIARTWAAVQEDLVCRETNTKVKGSSMWDDVTFPLAFREGDAAQAIYRTLEQSRTGVGSFRMILPDSIATFYWTAQVGKFALVNGGGQDDIIDADVQLFTQSQEVLIVTPA